MVRRRAAQQRSPSVIQPAERSNQRQLRVGEALRHALSKILRQGECRDPAVRDADITVSEVRTSPDLRNATVFVMPLGGANAAEAMAGLRRSAPFLRGLLAREVSLRRVPNLVFALDSSFDHANRIATLLTRPEVRRDLDQQTVSPEKRDDGG